MDDAALDQLCSTLDGIASLARTVADELVARRAPNPRRLKAGLEWLLVMTRTVRRAYWRLRVARAINGLTRVASRRR